MTLFCSAKEFYGLYRELSGAAHSVRLQAKGGSMYPFIKSGDWVDVMPVAGSADEIRKGDVILFNKDDHLYMHRVVGTKKDLFIAKGDLLSLHDGAITKEDVLARVVSVQRNGRSIDLNSWPSHLMSAAIADLGFITRHIILFFEKAARAVLAAVFRVQGLKIYRSLAKKALKADITVRDARPEDEEELRDLFLMGGHDIRENIGNIKKKGFWLVGERKGSLVGGLTVTRYEKDSGIWVIFTLEVKPLLRGLGIGELLVGEAVKKAGSSGARRVGLFVNKKARPALALYSKAGFKVSDDFPSEFNRSPDELYLSYEI